MLAAAAVRDLAAQPAAALSRHDADGQPDLGLGAAVVRRAQHPPRADSDLEPRASSEAVIAGGPVSLNKYLRFEEAFYLPGLLDAIRNEAAPRSDRVRLRAASAGGLLSALDEPEGKAAGAVRFAAGAAAGAAWRRPRACATSTAGAARDRGRDQPGPAASLASSSTASSCRRRIDLAQTSLDDAATHFWPARSRRASRR